MSRVRFFSFAENNIIFLRYEFINRSIFRTIKTYDRTDSKSQQRLYRLNITERTVVLSRKHIDLSYKDFFKMTEDVLLTIFVLRNFTVDD